MGIYVPGLVPLVSDIVEVELENRPESLSNKGRVGVLDEPVGIWNQRRGSEGRAIYMP